MIEATDWAEVMSRENDEDEDEAKRKSQRLESMLENSGACEHFNFTSVLCSLS